MRNPTSSLMRLWDRSGEAQRRLHLLGDDGRRGREDAEQDPLNEFMELRCYWIAK